MSRPKLIDSSDLGSKAHLVSGATFWETHADAELGIDRLFLSDGPNGIRKQVNDADHLGLSKAVTSTCYPTTGLAACSWDPDLMRRLGQALAADAIRLGVDVVLAPGVNVRRNPLCGRNFEYFSEDPFLTGQLASQMILGIQEKGVGACVKHFACNNQELGRLTLDVRVSDRALREIYLPAFRTCVKEANPWMLMTAYNKINGRYCTENSELLQDILRTDWGYEGVVVTDWGGIDDRVLSLDLGVDLEMPDSGETNAALIASACETSDTTRNALAASLGRLASLSAKLRAGRDQQRAVDPRLAYDIAAQSIVLLKNDRDTLPMRVTGKVLVVGAQARLARIQGSGSSKVTPEGSMSFIDVLSDRGIDFTYFADQAALEADPSATQAISAGQYDAVLVFAGLPEASESEGRDRKTTSLPSDHLALIDFVAQLTPKAVVILQNGGNVSMPFHSDVSALVECYLSGEAGMEALADVLTGSVNPSGKLTETVYASFKDCSCYGSYPGHNDIEEYKDGIFVGYRFADKFDADVTYPFGHGLSYTTFSLSDFVTDTHEWGDKHRVSVSVKVTNTGRYDGAEVVQLYLSKPDIVLDQPVRELVGFQKVRLSAGESQIVTMQLSERAFMSFSEAEGDWVFPGSDFELAVGRSSRDIAEKRHLQLSHPKEVHARISRNTSFGAALRASRNPEAVRALMNRFIEESGIDFDLGAPDEQFKWEVVSDFPLRSLVSFTKGKFSAQDLETAIDEISARDRPELPSRESGANSPHAPLNKPKG